MRSPKRYLADILKKPPAALLQGLFFFALLIYYPLSFSLSGLGGAAPSLTIFPLKLVAMSGIFILGLAAVWVSFPGTRLAILPAALMKAPLTVRYLLAFLAWLVLASLFSRQGFYLALFGSNVRYDGTLPQVMWFAVAGIAAALVGARRLPRALPPAFMVTGALLVGAWSLTQSYGYQLLHFLSPHLFALHHTGMPAASLGHQALVAAYLGVVLVIWSARQVMANRLSWWSLLISALLAGMLVGTGGRAGELAVLLVWTAFALYRGRRSGWRPVAAYSLAILAGGGVVFATNAHAQGRVESFRQVAEGGNSSFNHRLITWQAGIKAVLARPVFGWGPDQAADTVWMYTSPAQQRRLFSEFVSRKEAKTAVRKGKVLAYINPKTHRLGLVDMNYDKAHNYLIDMTLASGVPALLLFLGFLLSGLWALWKAASPLTMAVALGIVVYMIYGQAWFYTLNVDPMIWGLFGLGLGAAWLAEADRAGLPPPSR